MIPSIDDVFSNYSGVELRLLAKFKELIETGGAPSTWDKQMLARYQTIRAELGKELEATKPETVQMVSSLMNAEYKKAGLTVYDDLNATGVIKPLTATTLQKNAALIRIRNDITTGFEEMHKAILRTTDDVFRRILKEMTTDYIAGVTTRYEAQKRTLRELVDYGVKFKDKAGRTWTPEAYADMAIRTASHRAQIAGHEDALEANGLDLVIVQPGPRACNICDDWASKILSRSGTYAGTVTMKNMVTGEPIDVEVDSSLELARAAGFQHPNCRCSIRAYIPGATSPTVTARPPWDKNAYENQQLQRSLENDVRKAKRLAVTASSPQAQVAARALVEKRQAMLKSHVDRYPYLKRRSSREQVYFDTSDKRKYGKAMAAKIEPPKPVTNDSFTNAFDSQKIIDSGRSLYKNKVRFGDVYKKYSVLGYDDSDISILYSAEERRARIFGYRDEAVFTHRSYLQGNAIERDQKIFDYETNQLLDLVQNGKPTISIRPGVLDSILLDGRFKNQFETGTSGGALSPDTRKTVENAIFDYEPNVSVSRRPIYGYMTNHSDISYKAGDIRDSFSTTNPYVSHYGEIKVILKDSVKNRTTFTVGDSLDNSIFAHNLGAVTKEQLIMSGYSFQRNPGYIEAQIHNGVTTDDIEEIVCDKNSVAIIRNKLDKAGLSGVKVRWH